MRHTLRSASMYWPVDAAYAWLCRQRRDWGANADVWQLRAHWPCERKRLLRELRRGAYRFEPVRCCRGADGHFMHLWAGRDAVVLKALTLLVSKSLGLSGHCTHVRAAGGLKATVADVQRHLPHYRYVLRTDVFEYYAHIDHEVLLEQLAGRIHHRFLMNLLVQYLKHTVDSGGVYRDIRLGISRGCPLSPLIGAFYLKILDEALGNSGLYYVRYMDDILVLAPC